MSPSSRLIEPRALVGVGLETDVMCVFQRPEPSRQSRAPGPAIKVDEWRIAEEFPERMTKSGVQLRQSPVLPDHLSRHAIAKVSHGPAARSATQSMKSWVFVAEAPRGCLVGPLATAGAT